MHPAHPSPPAHTGAQSPAPIHALPQPLIGTGPVRHARTRPRAHTFQYSHYFWMLPMRRLAGHPVAAVRRNRWGLLSFHDTDHGHGGSDALAWLDALLLEAGLPEADRLGGEVWLQTFPRVLGFTFKPVSFWWVHRADRSLAAVVVEVNNTFGERHAYLLHGPALKLGAEVGAAKVFHVSPFCEARGRYRFRFMRTGPWGTGGSVDQPERLVVRVDHDDAQGPLVQTSQAGTLALLTERSARQAFWRWPLMTLAVVWRIHWQALHVWLKGTPFHRKPEPPAAFVTRSDAS